MVEEQAIITFIFSGAEEEHVHVPLHITHVIMHESVTYIPEGVFTSHPNIVQVYCHAGVKRMDYLAFYNCRRLKRVIMLGVERVEEEAFAYCESLEYVECPKLESIGQSAFQYCNSLCGIELPSAIDVRERAFAECHAILDAKFGGNLDRLGDSVFCDCPLLERLTVPLKVGVIMDNDVFWGCENLNRVDLVEEDVLRDTVAALHLEEWREDLTKKIDFMNQRLPDLTGGRVHDTYLNPRSYGEKESEIQEWIESVLGGVIDYKVRHRRLVNEAALILQQLAFPNDIVMRNVLPYLELPDYLFHREQRCIR